MFYCDLSQKCIEKHRVCDGNSDCFFNEDEKYCLALVNAGKVWLMENGRPLISTSGLVAYNKNGHWLPGTFRLI